jgi:hypothetical protein
MPSATAAAKNKAMPTCAARGARANVTGAETRIWKNRFTSKLHALPARPARNAASRQKSALVDVNAYGAMDDARRSVYREARRFASQPANQIAGNTARDR